MISLANVACSINGNVLYDTVNLDIFRGQRIGLVGANGSGKSTLIHIINQEIMIDAGDINRANGIELALMLQAMPDSTCTALAYVLQGYTRYTQLQDALQQAYAKEDDQQITHCLAQLDDMNGYHIEAEAASILHGLGFGKHDIHKAVNAFSGGWRMRLQLARALVQPSDVLLLDEPTNHLDIAAIEWLERFIKHYQGAVLLISHDRTFLDNVVTRIWHIEQQKIKAYKGNYSAFETLRAEHIKAQQALSRKQQQAITHVQKFVDRFRAKATKAKQVQSRLKALEKMEVIHAASTEIPFSFEFVAAQDIANPALAIEQLQLGYEQPLLSIKELTINSGERIGLLGVNGAGKSTLLKTLAGKMKPLAGGVTYSSKLNLGYYAQDQLEQLSFAETALWHLLQQQPQWTEQQLRNFLGGFNFCGDKVLQPVGNFSGGEQSRLMLALLASRQCNMLLLDEPTNHLDMDMRHALELSLQQFTGSYVIVSHDRYLLESCCDEFWLVDDGKLKPFMGDMKDYSEWLMTHLSMDVPIKKAKVSHKNKQKAQLEKQVKAIEQKIDKVNQQIMQVDAALSNADIYQDPSQQQNLEKWQQQQALNQAQLATLQDQWFLLIEQLEAFDGVG